MTTSGSSELPVAAALKIDAVCQRFEAAWKAAAPGRTQPQLEAYLAEVDELSAACACAWMSGAALSMTFI